MKIMYKKIWTLLFILFGLFMSADIILTEMVAKKQGHLLLESNPIFVLTNSFAFLVILNGLMFLFFFYVFYPKYCKTPNRLFFVISLVIYNVWSRFLAILDHIFLLRSETPIISAAEASKITAQQKITGYAISQAASGIVPLIMVMAIFMIFKMAADIQLKSGE